MDSTPSVRKPSQQYMDSAAVRATASVLVQGSVASSRGAGRPRIFSALPVDCPSQYYPEMIFTSPDTMRAFRSWLLLLCTTQVAVALGMYYIVSATHVLHDPLSEMFTEAVAALCAIAACVGIVGVCASSRPMLLFFYINQLWGLANLSTFAVISLSSADQSSAACRLFREGELTRAQLADRGLDCDAVQRTTRHVSYAVGFLLLLLLASCFLAKAYSEKLQDKENDEQDRALVNFVWQRRRETWAKLEKFEDLVLRQFEDLQSALRSRDADTATAAAAACPSPTAGGTAGGFACLRALPF